MSIFTNQDLISAARDYITTQLGDMGVKNSEYIDTTIIMYAPLFQGRRNGPEHYNAIVDTYCGRTLAHLLVEANVVNISVFNSLNCWDYVDWNGKTVREYYNEKRLTILT